MITPARIPAPKVGDKPLISVVVPAYNAQATIEQALESVFQQSLQDYEIIVVNDGSSDGTLAVLEAIADRRLRIVSQENSGVSVARNRGIAQAQGQYVLFLDADDLLAPSALERLLVGVERGFRVVFSYGEAVTFESPEELALERPPRPVFASRPDGDALPQILTANPVGSVGAALMRSSAIGRTRGFIPGIELGEDWVFWCTLAALGEVAYLGRESILYYRIHNASAARRLALDPQAARPAVAAIFALEGVRQRFSPVQLKRLQRAAEASCFAYSAREHLRRENWTRAREYFGAALARRPLRLREWILWGCAVVHGVPAPLRRFLK